MCVCAFTAAYAHSSAKMLNWFWPHETKTSWFIRERGEVRDFGFANVDCFQTWGLNCHQSNRINSGTMLQSCNTWFAIFKRSYPIKAVPWDAAIPAQSPPYFIPGTPWRPIWVCLKIGHPEVQWISIGIPFKRSCGGYTLPYPPKIKHGSGKWCIYEILWMIVPSKTFHLVTKDFPLDFPAACHVWWHRRVADFPTWGDGVSFRCVGVVLRLHCVVDGLLRSPLFLLDVAHCLPNDSSILGGRGWCHPQKSWVSSGWNHTCETKKCIV